VQIFLEPYFNVLAKKPNTVFNDHFPCFYPTYLHIQVAYIFYKKPTTRKKKKKEKKKKRTKKREKKGGEMTNDENTLHRQNVRPLFETNITAIGHYLKQYSL